MWVRRAAALVLAGSMIVAILGCRSVFRQYEYEEEIYLHLDGSADVVVNASLPALVALVGADLPVDPSAPIDRDKVRALYESPTTEVTRVSRPWRRAGRRFIQIRVSTADVRSLSRVAPFAVSSYAFAPTGALDIYRQVLGKPAGQPVPNAGWNGSEIAAVRLHVPSKIRDHNAPSRQIERGNILSWEQPFSDRLAGKPVAIEVSMDRESILEQTLIIFGLSAVAAFTLLGAIVWWVRRSGRHVAE